MLQRIIKVNRIPQITNFIQTNYHQQQQQNHYNHVNLNRLYCKSNLVTSEASNAEFHHINCCANNNLNNNNNTLLPTPSTSNSIPALNQINNQINDTDEQYYPTFNLSKSFKYLLYSVKYENYQNLTKLNSIKMNEKLIYDCFVNLGLNNYPDFRDNKNERNQLKIQFKNELRQNNLDNLELENRLAICDLVRQRIKIFRNYRDFFESYFKCYLINYLRENLSFKNNDAKYRFLETINPKLHLKILFYYAFFFLSHDLTDYENTFLSDYLNTSISQNYDYDIYELITLSHSIYKLNLPINQNTLDKILNLFKNSKKDEQILLYYNIVKLIRQQDYFDPNTLNLIRNILFSNIDRLQTKIIVNVLATITNYAIIDNELFQLISNTLIKRNDFRLNDIAKFLFCCAYSDYELIENRPLFHYLLQKTKEQKAIKYKYRSADSIDILKSLIMLNIYDFHLIRYFLNDPIIIKELNTSKLHKPKSDLYFILKSIEIEHNEFNIMNNFENCVIPIAKHLPIELKVRTDFNNFLNFLQQTIDVKFDYEFVYPLPHINIASIQLTYFKNKIKETILLELQDESNTFRNQPNRQKIYFKVKLRQLNALNLKYILFKKDGNTFVKI